MSCIAVIPPFYLLQPTSSGGASYFRTEASDSPSFTSLGFTGKRAGSCASFTADSLVLTENRDRAVQFPVRVAHLSSIAVAPLARVSKVGSGGCAGGIISGESWAVVNSSGSALAFTRVMWISLASAFSEGVSERVDRAL